MSEQQDLVQRAAAVLPGGVLGTARFPEGLEVVVREASGAYITDVDGRRYIDYLLGSGPMLLGHAHPTVVSAVERQLARGTTYFLVNEPIIELAEELVRAVPCAEQVRFASTGTEATFFALRVARAFRRRDKIMKFEGGYHGTHDYASMSATPRSPKAFPAATPDSAGIPSAIDGEVLVAPYNDLATVEALLAAHHQELAAVIVEPYQRVIVPAPGFLSGLRAVTRRYDVPLVFDEVVTGFRLAYGGAQEYYGVLPDLAALGKVIGGGFPLAAVCGRADIMRHFDPALDGTADYVQQVGTLNGNPVSAVAGLATLAELRKPGTYDRLRAMGTRLRDGLAAAVRRRNLKAQVTGEAAVFDVVFTEQPIVDYRSTLMADRWQLARFNEECLRRGVIKGGQKIYVSLAHTEADIDRTLRVFDEALGVIAAAR